ncbi:MFS general substrate transporter [Phlebopus sp. FC_14]|nr:MFS general substrate transporter [Phlebopus sp. FC_14]
MTRRYQSRRAIFSVCLRHWERGFLVQICSYGYTISFGVYQDFYAQHYLPDQSSSAISWIGSTNAFLFEIFGLVSGRLHDRGYFYHVMIGGATLQALSLFMLSLAGPGKYYQIFLAQGIGSGIASGLIFIPSLAVLSHHFEKRLALVMMLVASGTCFGSIIHPIMLNNMLNGRLGFANGVRVSAGLISALLFIACLVMRTRLPSSSSPENFLQVSKKCLRDSAYLFGAAGLTLFIIWFYYPLFYLQLNSFSHNLNTTFSFYSLVIMNSASFVGQLASGLLANVFGVTNAIILSNVGATALLFAMVGIRTVTSVVLFGVIYGFFAGAFLSLWAPVLTLLTPDLAELGARMGLACVIMALGGLVGPPISGALLTDQYIWWRTAVFNGAVAAVGTVFLMIMKVILARRRCDSVTNNEEGE